MPHKYLRKYKGPSGKYVYVYPDSYYDKYDGKSGNLISKYVTGSYYKNVGEHASNNFERASRQKKNVDSNLSYLNSQNANNPAVSRMKSDYNKQSKSLSAVRKQSRSDMFVASKEYSKSLAGKIDKIKHKINLITARHDLNKKKASYAKANKKLATKRKINKIFKKFGIKLS